MQFLGSMISGDNGGDLNGVSSMNDAECALDHWLLARRSLGVLIVVAFMFFSLLTLSHLYFYSLFG